MAAVSANAYAHALIMRGSGEPLGRAWRGRERFWLIPVPGKAFGGLLFVPAHRQSFDLQHRQRQYHDCDNLVSKREIDRD
jgi:hypothetical protein